MYSIGLDVSKSTIVVYIPKNDQILEIPNSIEGLERLYAKLKKLYKKELNEVVFVFEPTGSYSKLLEKFCHQKQIKAFIIHPKQSSHYAKALKRRNKSDTIDAKVLSMAIALADQEEIKVPQIDPVAEEIKELMGFYHFTLKERVRATNHLEAIRSKEGSAYIIETLEKRIEALKKEEKRILEQIGDIIEKDATLKQKLESIKSIKGVGDITAIVLLHLFLRYPDASRTQIVSLTGLDPIERSSGTSVKSKTRISKAGDKLYRGMLFMSALVAIRHNDEMRAFYERLKARGKHSTAAQVAVMRKIVLVAHALYKNGQMYDSKRYLQYQGNRDKMAA